MGLSIVFTMLTLEVAFFLLFRNSSQKKKIVLFSILCANIHLLKNLSLACGIEEDVLWGVIVLYRLFMSCNVAYFLVSSFREYKLSKIG